MAILHLARRETYTVVDNVVLRDPELSWRAKGLWTYLMGLPDGWRVNAADLSSRATDGVHAVRTIMRELETAGLLLVERRHAGNRWSTHITVAEAPGLFTEGGFSVSGGSHELGSETGDGSNPEASRPESFETREHRTLRKDSEGSTQKELPILLPELASETEATRSPAQVELDQLKDTFDALGLIPATANPWPLVNRVATMIRDQGGTPADVLERAGLLTAEWGASKLTLTSLEKHWHRYDEGGVGRLSKADVDAWNAAQEKSARSARRLREVEERAAETEAYQADVRMLRDRARSQGRSDELDKGDYR